MSHSRVRLLRAVEGGGAVGLVVGHAAARSWNLPGRQPNAVITIGGTMYRLTVDFCGNPMNGTSSATQSKMMTVRR